MRSAAERIKVVAAWVFRAYEVVPEAVPGNMWGRWGQYWRRLDNISYIDAHNTPSSASPALTAATTRPRLTCLNQSTPPESCRPLESGTGRWSRIPSWARATACSVRCRGNQVMSFEMMYIIRSHPSNCVECVTLEANRVRAYKVPRSIRLKILRSSPVKLHSILHDECIA